MDNLLKYGQIDTFLYDQKMYNYFTKNEYLTLNWVDMHGVHFKEAILLIMHGMIKIVDDMRIGK